MKFETITITKRYAPPIHVAPEKHEFLGKAKVYDRVWDHIHEYCQDAELYFTVSYGLKAVEIFYGKPYVATVTTNTTITHVTDWNSIPAGAIKIAEATVMSLFGSL